MLLKNKNILFVFLGLILLITPTLILAEETFTRTDPSGLKVKMVKKSDMEFIKAHLLIHFENNSDPSLPFLTVINLFDQSHGRSRNSLLSILNRMGNDFKVKYCYDHIIIKINFLPDHLGLFANFLKTLYEFNFTNLNQFNFSKKNLFKIFKRDDSWKQKMATQIAYQSIFKDHSLGNSFVFKNSLDKLNIVNIRSFFKKSFIPKNTLLFIKGDINPYITWGIIKKELTELNISDSITTKSLEIHTPISIPERKIFIFPIQSQSPILFSFTPENFTKDFFLKIIRNEIFFGEFTGLIRKIQNSYRLKIHEIKNNLLRHQSHFVFSNSFTIQYQSINNFLKLLSEISGNSQMNYREFNRNEILDSIYYIKNYSIIQSANLDINLDNMIYDDYIQTIPPIDQESYYVKPTLVINYLRHNSRNSSNSSNNHNQPVIVIFGDPEKIFKYYPQLQKNSTIIRENDYYLD